MISTSDPLSFGISILRTYWRNVRCAKSSLTFSLLPPRHRYSGCGFLIVPIKLSPRNTKTDNLVIIEFSYHLDRSNLPRRPWDHNPCTFQSHWYGTCLEFTMSVLMLTVTLRDGHLDKLSLSSNKASFRSFKPFLSKTHRQHSHLTL